MLTRDQINLFGVCSIASVILYYSIRPVPGTPYNPSIGSITLLYHGIAYFALAAALLTYFHDTPRGHMAAVVAATLFGAGIEVIQLFLPTRLFAMSDLLMNGLGASLVLLDRRSTLVTRLVRLEDQVIENYLSPLFRS